MFRIRKSIKCLSFFPVASTVRNFDRSSVRSRSFRRLNRAFSVLRRTKSGNAVSNETSEERDNARNSNVPREGMDQGLRVLSRCVHLRCTLLCFCCTFCIVPCLVDVSAAFTLYDSPKRLPEGLSVCVNVSGCVYLHCSLSCTRRVTRLGANSVTVAYVSLIIQLQIA